MPIASTTEYSKVLWLRCVLNAELFCAVLCTCPQKSFHWRHWFGISWQNSIYIVAMVFPTVILLITVSVGFKTQTKITVLLSVNNKYRLTGWNHLHLKTLTEVNNTRNQQTIAQFTAVCWPQYSADFRWSLSLLRFRRSWTKARLQRVQDKTPEHWD